jgi:glycosyl transferase, family 25
MIKSYLINLDKDRDRLEFFSKNFSRLGLTFERVAAIDGRLYSEQEHHAFEIQRPRNYNRQRHKPWLRGQMGCFLSHMEVWRRIAEGKENFCAVFEDDEHISDDLRNLLFDDQWIPPEADVIRLETSTNRVRLSARPILTYLGRSVYKVKSTSWCAGAYLISRDTARALVALDKKYHEPADVILYNFEESVIAPTLNILQFNPALCTQDKHLASGNIQFASNIEAGTGAIPKVAPWKKYSPASIANGVYKSLLGYKRIGF